MSFGGPLNLRPFPPYMPLGSASTMCPSMSLLITILRGTPFAATIHFAIQGHKGSQSIRYMKHPSSWSSQHLPFEAIWQG